MNRRTTLNTLLDQPPISKTFKPKPTSFSLDTYTGEWTADQAAHLLRRTMFGVRKEEIDQAVELGLSGTIDLLFQERPMPDPPINFDYETDEQVPIGSTWVDAHYTSFEVYRMEVAYRRRSLNAWTMNLLINNEFSIREKMTLFWHNHFVVERSVLIDEKYLYNYITLLRSSALGNFRQLTKEVSIDPAMLSYLNGNRNTKDNPNENYARELLELFTVGKGQLAGPGDYTTFTEEDVLAIAKVMTGWRTLGNFSSLETIQPKAIFSVVQHDTSNKQLSNRFNNALIEHAGAEEYANLIDVIFHQRTTAEHLSRKLYRWFVFYTIDEVIEQTIIQPMAQLLIDNDFEIIPALKSLLSSQHFYQVSQNVGGMIKHPIDFVVGLLRQFPLKEEPDILVKYPYWEKIYDSLQDLQMSYYQPPDVGGWRAFYQSPNYYRIWITAATLGPRVNFTNLIATRGMRINNHNFKIDVLAVAKKIENNTDPNAIIEGFVRQLFPQTITDNQKNRLKNILLPGLPDFEWTVEFTAYLEDPDNGAARIGSENRLKALLKAMLVMPEFYLS